MALQFPDVSNYQQGFSLTPYPAAIAKASEGTTFTDATYRNFKAQAAALKIPFAAYHWLNTADLQAQAEHAYSVAGSVPMMWDCEADGATVPRILEITARYRKLGGTATLVYLPRWWWRDHLGSPDLTPLQQAGLSLISSAYPSGGYSDNGIGWAAYGGVAPTIWQYTSTPHDMNAFKGTAAQLAAVFAGNPPQEDDMTEDESRRLFNIDGMLWYGFVNGEDVPPGGMRLGAGAGTPNADPIPVWAVEHIKALEAKVAELEAKIDALQPASGVAAHTHEGGTSGPVA